MTASMGDRNLLKPLLERKGSVHFGRKLMKPGKPPLPLLLLIHY
jgi:molybdopterin biosynthesis enzyme